MSDHIYINADESDALLNCLVRAVDVGEATGNLDLMAMAEDCADLIIAKWLSEGGR